eukprot:12908851-Prorocentrum_lima.AAC.1
MEHTERKSSHPTHQYSIASFVAIASSVLHSMLPGTSALFFQSLPTVPSSKLPRHTTLALGFQSL